MHISLIFDKIPQKIISFLSKNYNDVSFFELGLGT